MDKGRFAAGKLTEDEQKTLSTAANAKTIADIETSEEYYIICLKRYKLSGYLTQNGAAAYIKLNGNPENTTMISILKTYSSKDDFVAAFGSNAGRVRESYRPRIIILMHAISRLDLGCPQKLTEAALDTAALAVDVEKGIRDIDDGKYRTHCGQKQKKKKK